MKDAMHITTEEMELRRDTLQTWEYYHIFALLDAIGPVALCAHTRPIEETIADLDKIYTMYSNYIIAKNWPKGGLL